MAAYQSCGPQAPVNEMRILLLGKTGCGKSKTGNTILGDIGFFAFGNCSNSVTNACFLRTNTRFDKKIDVIDTPGVFDTKRSNNDILLEIKRCITLTSPGPNAVIVCVKIGRHTDEDNEALKHFVNFFGEKLLKYTIFLFTHLDQWQDDCEGLSSPLSEDEYIKNIDNEYLHLLFKKCNNRYIFFNNRLKDKTIAKDEQVKKLLEMIEDMVRVNDHRCFTNEHYVKVEQLLQEELENDKEKTRDDVKQSETFFRRIVVAMKKFFGIA